MYVLHTKCIFTPQTREEFRLTNTADRAATQVRAREKKQPGTAKLSEQPESSGKQRAHPNGARCFSAAPCSALGPVRQQLPQILLIRRIDHAALRDDRGDISRGRHVEC